MDSFLPEPSKRTASSFNVNEECVEELSILGLMKLLQDFSFAGADISIESSANIFTALIDGTNAIFFSEETWGAEKPESFIGIMITLPVGFGPEFVTKFNQLSKIGRLYNIEPDSSALRHNLHLNGGVTKKNIFYQINAFVDAYKSLLPEVEKLMGAESLQ